MSKAKSLGIPGLTVFERLEAARSTLCVAIVLLCVHLDVASGAAAASEESADSASVESGEAAGPESSEAASTLAIPDISEALQLDVLLGELVEERFDSLKHPALSTSLLGRLTAAALFVLVGLIVLRVNSAISRRLDRAMSGWRVRRGLAADRFSLVFLWQRWAGYTVGLASLIYLAQLMIGDAVVPALLSALIQGTVDNGAGIAAVVLVVILVWEGVNAGIERLAAREGLKNSARARTLLPVVRNIVLFALLLMTALVVLSELGIEIMPILAGAGVVGIAIGFGAQTLVKDFLTGFTIIIEDLLQIGDVVRIADRTGAVSQITLRKIELRALDGTVHTVPFSAIDIVDNLTKEYSYYLMDIGVAYKENTDAVVDCLRDIDKSLRQDPQFAYRILEPLEVLGVDQFADSAVVIKARIKTRAMEKWNVGREFNRRMKQAFDEIGIEIPFPHQTVFLNAKSEDFAVHTQLDSLPEPAARSLGAAR